MNLSRLLCLLPLAAAAGYVLAPSDANAAYSGTITRSVCGVAAVPQKVDRNYFDYTGACALVISDASNPTTWHYAALSVPVERETSTASISTRVDIQLPGFGTGACAQSFVFDSSGTLSATGSNDCWSFGDPAYLIPSSLTLPVDGSVSLSLAGQHNLKWLRIGHTWAVNAT